MGMAFERALGKRADDFFGDSFQQELARWNHARLAPSLPTDDWEAQCAQDSGMVRREGAFLEALGPRSRKCRGGTGEPAQFLDWFESLKMLGRARTDRCSNARRGGHIDQMRRFLTQKRQGSRVLTISSPTRRSGFPTSQAGTGAQLLGRNGAGQSQRNAWPECLPAGDLFEA